MSGGQYPAAAPASADASTRRFRIDDFPERDRLEAWREIVGRAVMKVEIECIRDQPYFGDVTLRALPDLCMSSGKATGMQFRRPPALIDSDDLVMQVSLGGGFRAHQRGFTLGKGEAVLMSAGQTGLVSFLDEPHFTFRVPSRVLSPIVGDLDAVLYRPIPKDTEALQLLISYADAIQQMPALAKPDVRHLAAAHIRDLIALTLGATRDAAELANGRGLRAARLRAIKTDIADHIGSGNLSIGELATRHRVTPRYIQMLFETEGTTFTDFVLNARLLRAHRMLTDPRLANRPITSVAFDAGFQDLSYFNRTFRRHFGGTPSDVRNQARRDDA
jgi:AraC-like DNA-binding protein